MSESEASENEEHKFRVDNKSKPVEDSLPDVRPILRQHKTSENKKTASIDIENNKPAAHKRKFDQENRNDSPPQSVDNTSKDETENSNVFEFKSDLLFELDM